ncbi:MAG: OB-fold nucleic acid binding domain-containing protein [Candidatus Micrarchaeota archaeon]
MITDINTILTGKLEGNEVTLKGWIYRHRIGSAGGMVFAVLRDSTGVLQTTVKKDRIDENSWKDANEAYIESSVIVTGTVKKDDRAPGGYELEVNKFDTVTRGEPFPIAKRSFRGIFARCPSSLD